MSTSLNPPPLNPPLRLIIDTDTAGDDATALLLALRWPGVALEAITINAGNVAFAQEVENALYTVEVAGRSGEVPVYPGCDRPLLRDWETIEYIHGRDGMGDSFFPAAKQRPERQHAVEALVERIAAAPGEITIVAQAPLTNIAMAVRRDPTFAGNVKHLWVMGGTNNFLGNVTPAAEYNFWVDPDAAKIVFSAGFDLTMVGWEICCRHGVLLDDELAEIEAIDKPLARFYTDIGRVVRRFNRENHGIFGNTHPDSIVVAMAINEQVMTRSGRYFVDIETCGEITRGYSAVDLQHSLRRPPNARVCEEADKGLFKSMLLEVLTGMN